MSNLDWVYNYQRNGLIVGFKKGQKLKRYGLLNQNMDVEFFHEGEDSGPFKAEIDSLYKGAADGNEKLIQDMRQAHKKYERVFYSKHRTLFDVACYMVSYDSGPFIGQNRINREIMEGFISDDFRWFAKDVLASEWEDIHYLDMRFSSGILGSLCNYLYCTIMDTRHKIKTEEAMF